MEKKVLLINHDKALKQRNLFLGLSGIMFISNIFLSLKVYLADTKLIMVPGLEREVELSGSHVSASYLEEMSNMFLSHLLDLAPTDVTYKKQKVLKFTTAGNFRDIEKYFQDQEEKVKKFKISTYFTAKELLIDERNLRVKALGTLASHFCQKGAKEQEISCYLQFSYKGGVLRLGSFSIEEVKEQ